MTLRGILEASNETLRGLRICRATLLSPVVIALVRMCIYM
jgi:hypothetical protein